MEIPSARALYLHRSSRSPPSAANAAAATMQTGVQHLEVTDGDFMNNSMIRE